MAGYSTREEIVMGNILTGDQMRGPLSKLAEIQRQLLQKSGYPFSCMKLEEHLQAAIEGRFVIENRGWWKSEDGLIHFSVTSDGTTGAEWVKRLEKKGYRLSSYAKSVLLSADFQPTKPDTFRIAVVPGSLFTSDPTTMEVCQELDRRGLSHGKAINAELACLIREKFSDKELAETGLWWIVVMHEPIKDSGGRPGLLRADRLDDGSWLYAYYDDPGSRWYRRGGFAGVVSQVSA